MQKVAIIVGTTRTGRKSPLVAKYFLNNLPTSSDIIYEIIDIASFDLPFLDEESLPQTGIYTHEKTKKWSKKISEYAGFILLVPQYNWGYPASLKNALDLLYNEWQGKPTCLVTFGGHGGSQAQIAMRLVLQGLKMPILSVAPMLTLDPKDDDHTTLAKLVAYDHLLPTIDTEFRRYLQ